MEWKLWKEPPCSGNEFGENEGLLEKLLATKALFDTGFLGFSDVSDDDGIPQMRIYGDGKTVTVEVKETFEGDISVSDCDIDEENLHIERRLIKEYVNRKYDESATVTDEYGDIYKLYDMVYDCGMKVYDQKEKTLEDERDEFESEVEQWLNPEPDYDWEYESYAGK